MPEFIRHKLGTNLVNLIGLKQVLVPFIGLKTTFKFFKKVFGIDQSIGISYIYDPIYSFSFNRQIALLTLELAINSTELKTLKVQVQKVISYFKLKV